MYRDIVFVRENITIIIISPGAAKNDPPRPHVGFRRARDCHGSGAAHWLPDRGVIARLGGARG